MAQKDLQHFLIAISKFSALRDQFRKNPDQVMGEAKLSKKEKDLVKSGDAKKIRAYLGDFAAGSKVDVSYE